MMDWSTFAIVGIAVVAACGFVFLAWTMLAVWKSLESRKDSLFGGKIHGHYMEEPVSPEDCYDDCMKKAGWNSSYAHSCATACQL